MYLSLIISSLTLAPLSARLVCACHLFMTTMAPDSYGEVTSAKHPINEQHITAIIDSYVPFQLQIADVRPSLFLPMVYLDASDKKRRRSRMLSKPEAAPPLGDANYCPQRRGVGRAVTRTAR